MSSSIYKVFMSLLWIIGIIVTAYIIYYGFPYYKLPVEERFWSSLNYTLKPSGITGHGLGIIGSLMMIIGVAVYMLRKRVRIFLKAGLLKHWLGLHIFLCTIGPILIMFHTTFKFGGIVAVSFWCMAFVVLSGVIGRFIYIQIPRSIRGEELSLKELNLQNNSLSEKLQNQIVLNNEVLYKIDDMFTEHADDKSFVTDLWFIFTTYFSSLNVIRKVNIEKSGTKNPSEINEIKKIIREKVVITRKIKTLRTAHKLFGYWHAVHLPFAIVMFVIMIIHIVTSVIFGYKWIF